MAEKGHHNHAAAAEHDGVESRGRDGGNVAGGH